MFDGHGAGVGSARVQTVDLSGDDLSRRRFLATAGTTVGVAGLLALGRPSLAEAAACGEGCFDVTDFGAVGNGSTDDSAAFQEALDAAAEAAGGVIIVPGGTYRIDSPLKYEASNLLLDFAPNAVIDFSNAATTELFLEIRGGEASEVALTSNADEGETTLSVASGAESGFSAGDWVKVGSNALHDPDPENEGIGVDVKIGEQARVLSVASGKITLAWTLAGGAYDVADSAFVQQVTHRTNVRVHGGTFIGGGNAAEHDLFRFTRCRDVEIRGVRAEYFTGRVCTLDDTVNGTIADNTFVGGIGPANGFYGVSLVWASQDCTVYGNSFTDFRHAVEIGGTTAKSGINRRHVITSNHAVATTAAAFESHSGCDDITYAYNTALDCNSGVSVRGPRFTIIGNVIRRPVGVGIFTRNQTTEPTQVTITGNRVSDSGVEGIRVSSDSRSVGGGAAVAGATIADNVVERPGEYGIAVGSTDSWTMENAAITGNVVNEPAVGEHGIYLFKVRHANVSGNTVVNLQPQVSAHGAIRLENVTKSSVSGNALTAANVQGAGIRLASASLDNTIVGNTVNGFTRGMYFDATATGNVVGSNSLSGNTIPMTLGSGAGNTSVPADQLGVVASIKTISADADITLAIFSDPPKIVHTGTLTTTRTVTLSTVHAYPGACLRISRTGTGAYDLEVGEGPLIALAQNEWCEVTYVDTAWVLTAAGSLA